MKRRSLLGAMLAACAAPAFVKAGVLMPVRKVWVPSGGLRMPAGLRIVLLEGDRPGMFHGGVGQWNGVRFIESHPLTPEQARWIIAAGERAG